MPGLTVAAVVGGSFGIGRIHDPSHVVAGIVNFLLYGVRSFFVLKKVLKPSSWDNGLTIRVGK